MGGGEPKPGKPGNLKPLNALPRPNKRPGSEVVIYDGQCPVCRASVTNLNKWDSRQRLSYLSLDDPEVRRRYPDLQHDDLMQAIHVVDSEGHRFRGAEALRAIARRITRLRPIVPLLYVPGSMALLSWGYRWFAARRARDGQGGECEKGTCGVPWDK